MAKAMAAVLALSPLDLTFNNLVGGTMSDPPSRRLPMGVRRRRSGVQESQTWAGALDRHDCDHIGQQLRGMYGQLLEEPVPGHLLMLMARLERQNRKQSDDR